MLKQTFCWLYDRWLSKVVGKKSDPLVRLLDALFGSECKYCMAARCLAFGIGLGMFSWLGLGLMALAILMTLGERYWLCDVKSKHEKDV